MVFRPSGGLLYHSKAWLHGRNWQTFRQQLQAWLSSWNAGGETLLLIGPSGGYTLPDPWLSRYKCIEAFDVDPLAGFFFRRQHPKLNVRFHRFDVFGHQSLLSLEPLAKVLAQYQDADILFANVLGQLLLEKNAKEEQWAAFLLEFRAILKDRNWASYHDLVSEHGHNECIDHLMQGEWSAGLPKTEWHWQLTPTQTHLIEGLISPSV